MGCCHTHRPAWRAAACCLAAGLLLAVPRPSPGQDVSAIVDEAGRLKRDGRLAEAERRLGDALMLAPADAEAWWLNAWVQLGLQDNPAALLAFRKAARLLPADDARVAQATAQAEALAAAGVTVPAPAPPPPRPAPLTSLPRAPSRPAPLPSGNPWAGWPLALLLLAATIGCGAAWVVVRSDARHGPRSPQARLAHLARRLARGEQVPAAAAMSLALHPELAHLPEDDRVVVVAAAAASHPPSRARLTALVTSQSGPVQRIAALALARQQEQPAPELWTGLLDADDATLRQAALRGLAQQPDPAALALLGHLARSSSEDEAVLAVAVLAKLRDEAAYQALAALPFAKALPAAAEAAVAALGARRRLPASLAEPVAKMLDSDLPLDRVTLVQALAATREAGVPRLLEALLDDMPEVRAAAAAWLGQMTVPEALLAPWAKGLAAEPGRASLEALRWLSTAAPGAAAAVLERVLLAEPVATEIRLVVIELLTAHPADGADQVLLRAFQRVAPAPRPDAGVQALAEALAAALATRGVTDALPALLEWAGLQPESPSWWRAARTLAARPAAGEALAAAVGQSASKVRRLAAALLAEHPHPIAADALLAELSRAGSERTAPVVLRDCAAALGALGERRALEPLRTLLARHPDLADDRFDVALAQLGDEAAQSRVEAMLLRPEPAGRRPAAAYFRAFTPVPPRAAGVVAEAAAHTAAQALLAAPQDPVPGLVALGEAVVPTLHEWLHDPVARLEAAAALEQLGDADAAARGRLFERIDQLATGDAPLDGEFRALLTRDPAAAAYARARLGEERWQATAAGPESS